MDKKSVGTLFVNAVRKMHLQYLLYFIKAWMKMSGRKAFKLFNYINIGKQHLSDLFWINFYILVLNHFLLRKTWNKVNSYEIWLYTKKRYTFCWKKFWRFYSCFNDYFECTMTWEEKKEIIGQFQMMISFYDIVYDIR